MRRVFALARFGGWTIGKYSRYALTAANVAVRRLRVRAQALSRPPASTAKGAPIVSPPRSWEFSLRWQDLDPSMSKLRDQ